VNEADPNGIDPHTPGAKLDAGKLRAGLCVNGFSRALAAVAGITTYGATKYTPNGWRAVPDGLERYTDALYRHLLASATEAVDPESGHLHLAHAAWNALAVLELTLQQPASKPAPSVTLWSMDDGNVVRQDIELTKAKIAELLKAVEPWLAEQENATTPQGETP